MDDAPTAGANAGAMVRECMRDRRLQPAHSSMANCFSSDRILISETIAPLELLETVGLLAGPG